MLQLRVDFKHETHERNGQCYCKLPLKNTRFLQESFANFLVLKGKGVMDDYCKNIYLEISRIPSDADMHTRNFHFHAMELSGTLY